ncbi:DUF2461 family protein [Anaerotignum lactatifermentans]|uniref:DUF2461 family protein n=1 Tax=Anaerotignum lactatifermentans TaxID=160404 RepID=UPI00255C5E1C|nr:DUF2461 family protein [Anaerotignum lactatifermentans]
MTDFTGFTPETIDFLWELRMNNNKAWMEENRERYRTVLKEPFDALSVALTKKFLEKKNVPQMDLRTYDKGGTVEIPSGVLL